MIKQSEDKLRNAIATATAEAFLILERRIPAEEVLVDIIKYHRLGGIAMQLGDPPEQEWLAYFNGGSK